MNMKNPWQKIPLEDYEAHMESPEVGQTQMLNEIFKEILDSHNHKSIAVIGCTSGNGFEHVDNNEIDLLFGIDINEEYIHSAKEKYFYFGNKLKLATADIEDYDFGNYKFDLIHCALIFEYVNVGTVLQKLAAALNPYGKISVVLQLANPGKPAVTVTQYKSLETLSPILNLLNPENFNAVAEKYNLKLIESRIIKLKSGKEFYFGKFKKLLP